MTVTYDQARFPSSTVPVTYATSSQIEVRQLTPHIISIILYGRSFTTFFILGRWSMLEGGSHLTFITIISTSTTIHPIHVLVAAFPETGLHHDQYPLIRSRIHSVLQTAMIQTLVSFPETILSKLAAPRPRSNSEMRHIHFQMSTMKRIINQF